VPADPLPASTKHPVQPEHSRLNGMFYFCLPRPVMVRTRIVVCVSASEMRWKMLN